MVRVPPRPRARVRAGHGTCRMRFVPLARGALDELMNETDRLR